jgi:hypothetical protein
MVIYFLYKHEYGTLKPVDVTVRRGWGRRENNGGDEPNRGITHVYRETPCIAFIY